MGELDPIAIDKADEAYREICVTQGLQYAAHRVNRDVLLCAVINAYLEAADFKTFLSTGGEFVRGWAE